MRLQPVQTGSSCCSIANRPSRAAHRSDMEANQDPVRTPGVHCERAAHHRCAFGDDKLLVPEARLASMEDCV
jgi:hypothetical protein